MSDFSQNYILFLFVCLIFYYSWRIIKVWKKGLIFILFYSFPWKYSTFSNALVHLLSHLQVGVLKSVAAVLTWDIDNPELWNKGLIAYGRTLPQSRERYNIKLHGFLPGWEAAPLSFNPSPLVCPFFLGKACKILFMYVVIQFVPRLRASM